MLKIDQVNIKYNSCPSVKKTDRQLAKAVLNSPKDELSISSNNKNKKVSFAEGVKLVAQGFVNQAKDIVTGIIKHPIKTIATIGATTAGLLALPIVGIPTAVGGGVLAIGFGLLASAKMLINTGKAIKHSKNGEYDKARDDYKNIGKSGVDLALSLPFVPKAIKSIKEFAKYGKIGINHALLQELKNANGLSEKVRVINNANTEFARSYDYQRIVDSHLEKMQATSAEKALIKKELLEFNVPEEKILEVAMDKLAKHKGYKTSPKLVEEQLQSTNCGQWNSNTGEIVINKDRHANTSVSGGASGNIPTDKLKLKKVETYDTNNYKFTMENPVTGEVAYEIVPKKIYDNYRSLYTKMDDVSPRGQKLLTMVHEYEHFHQDCLQARRYGIDPKLATPGKKLQLRVVREQGNVVPNSQEWIDAGVYRNAELNYTSKNFGKYIQNELEVGARNAEARAMNSAEFKRLDAVLAEIKDSYKSNNIPNIILAGLQSESAMN